MPPIPNRVCEIVGLSVGASASELIAYVRQHGAEFFDGLLASEESCLAVEASLTEALKFKIRIENQTQAIQNKFCSLQFKNGVAAIRVGLIGEVHTDLPATELEKLIVWTLVDSSFDWPEASVNNGSPPLNWRQALAGKAIIAEPNGSGMSKVDEQMVSAIFGLSYLGNIDATPTIPLVASASTLNADVVPHTFTPVQVRLLQECSSTQHPKWRFLSFYRLLENAYLSNVKNALLKEFDGDASSAVENGDHGTSPRGG